HHPLVRFRKGRSLRRARNGRGLCKRCARFHRPGERLNGMTHRIIPADPFTIAVSDDEIDDLQRRLAATRLPNEPLGNEHWDYGTNLSYMEKLLSYWRNDFDWRAQEENLNRFPQYRATLKDEDGEEHTIHFIY